MTARFIDNNGITITDTKTGFVWSKATIANTISYKEAEETLLILDKNLRLPTLEELLTLLDYTKLGPAIDTKIFPDTENYAYWTSTPCVWDNTTHWVVRFHDGVVYGSDRSTVACVRAIYSSSASVRPDPAQPSVPTPLANQLTRSPLHPFYPPRYMLWHRDLNQYLASAPKFFTTDTGEATYFTEAEAKKACQANPKLVKVAVS